MFGGGSPSLEEKPDILGRLIQQRLVTEDAIFYKATIGEGLLAPAFLAYAKIFDFVACPRTEEVRGLHRQLTCTTKVRVQVLIVKTTSE